MEETQKSQADLLREHINKRFDEKYDYTQQSSKLADMKFFLELHKDRKWTLKNIRGNHNRILDEVAQNRGIDKRAIKVGIKKPRFNSELAASIQAAPVDGVTDETRTQTTKTGAPIQTTTAGTGTEIQTVKNNNIDEEGVAATFNAIYISIRATLPELEALTDEEKKSLGKMWLPAFQKYLDDKLAIILIPTLATLGMFAPKIAKARKAKLEKQAKEKAQKEKLEPKVEN